MIGLLLVVCLASALPVEASTAAPLVPTVKPSRAEESVQDRLALLAESIEQRAAEIAALRTELLQASGVQRDDLAAVVDARQRELQDLEQRFRAIASGVDLRDLEEGEKPDVGWSGELRELLAPLIAEIKSATSRPRRIHRLEREIEVISERLTTAERGLANVERSKAARPAEPLNRLLAEVERRWATERERLRAELAFTEQELRRLRGEETSVYGTVERVFRVFFRSRGRNLVLALLAFAGTWAAMRVLQTAVRRWGPLRRRGRSTAVRVFDLTYALATVVVAALAALFVLYVAGDWLLLSLATLLLFGIVWASKTALPRVWRQCMLLLNLGSIREGERILFEGVPYRVDALSFETRLVNPELAGGSLRLHMRMLDGLRSRPFTEDEPWFPTRGGDWVLLEDGKHGRVAIQTPEIVTIVELGGARRHFRTSDFFRQPPRVLSAGFRLRMTFGIDYRHQREATGLIPRTLKQRIERAIADAGHADELRHLEVDFKEAGASALDLAILVDLSGAAAPHYQKLKRLVQRTCVETCTEHDWVIPFTQVTLHMASAQDGAGVENAAAPPAGAARPDAAE